MSLKRQLEIIIDEYIIGKNAERDRKILKRRLIDGICIEPLAEEFNLSVSQINRILKKRKKFLLKINHT